MTPEEYAEHKRFRIQNPPHRKGAREMATRSLTRGQMQARIDALQEENENLSEKLESILNVASDQSEEDDDEDSD